VSQFRRLYIVLTCLSIIIAMLFIGNTQPAKAATSITGYTVQIDSGPTNNCLTGTSMAMLTQTVFGHPGGSGNFSINFTLRGVNQTAPSNIDFSDAELGQPILLLNIMNNSGWTAPGDTPTIEIDVRIGSTSYGGAIISFVCATNSYSVVYTGSFAANASGIHVPLFTDGRLNADGAEQTAAIYCLADGSIRIYVSATPKWVVSLTASPDDLASVPKNPAHNTLIKQGWKAQLNRLTGGELQVNSPGLNPSQGDYVFTFNDCSKT
jgi:hypothetical protein